MRAEPDGYTLIQVSNTNTVAAIQMVRNLPFDPLRDMATIGSIYQIPTVVLASKTFPANSCAEFLSVVRGEIPIVMPTPIRMRPAPPSVRVSHSLRT